MSKVPESDQDNEQPLMCDKCKALIEGMMQCESCLLWFRCTCGSFPLQTVEILRDCKTMLWFCEPCDNAISIPNSEHLNVLLANIEKSVTLCLERYPTI